MKGEITGGMNWVKIKPRISRESGPGHGSRPRLTRGGRALLGHRPRLDDGSVGGAGNDALGSHDGILRWCARLSRPRSPLVFGQASTCDGPGGFPNLVAFPAALGRGAGEKT